MKLGSLVSAGISVVLLSALVAPVGIAPVASASAATAANLRREAYIQRVAVARRVRPVPTKVVAPAPAPAPVPAPVPVTTLAKPDRWIGAFVSGSAENLTNLTTLEGKVGQTLTVRNYFQNTSQGFTVVQATAISDHGSIPMATLEFMNPAAGTGMSGGSYKQIANGSMDAYLIKYATNAKNFGRPVWLRPFHEMNGNWYPWAGTAAGNTPADFIAAWQHVNGIFKNAGATNVKFVWCPNADSVPNTTANAIAKYWPGGAYVDYIAIDGYNFGTTTSTWRSFSSVFGAAYATVSTLNATKPIIIAETGCGTVGGDKAAWITDMFKVIPTKFPRMTGVTWFNVEKERDWRIESTTASLAAFKTGIITF